MERPALAQSIDVPGERTAPEAWHWQPHHLQGRKELWHAMLLEADRESVRAAAQGPHPAPPLPLYADELHALSGHPDSCING